MSESFNPYVDWLGFTGGQQPADFYELLGIDRFQSDPAAISHAADVLISRIRRVRPGAYLAAWQDLLDQLRQAKACLLDPASKAAYDASLRGPSQPSPAEPVYAAPPTAQPPTGPVMALPPKSVWGAPQPSSPVAPQQAGPVAGPYAPASSPVSPGGHAGWHDYTSAPASGPTRPGSDRPGGYGGSQVGPAAGPYAPASSPVSPGGHAGWHDYTNAPAPGPTRPGSDSPGGYGGSQVGPTPGGNVGWTPPASPAGPVWNPPAAMPTFPAAQGWNPAGPQPGPQPPSALGPYPAQQPYPGPNAWTGAPGYSPAGYPPAGASPVPGQPAGPPQGYPAVGPNPAAPSWSPPGQAVPAQGWGYPTIVPTAQTLGLPSTYPSAAPAPMGAAPAGMAPSGAPWATEPAGSLPPIATVPGAYAPPAASPTPPVETPPAAAQASFVDDSLLHGIQPSTKLSRGPVRQKSSIVRTLVNLAFLAALIVGAAYGYKYLQKNLRGSRTAKTDLPVSAMSEVTPPPPPPPPGTSKETPPPTDSKKPDEKKPEAKPDSAAPAKEPDKSKPVPDKKPDGPGDPAKQKAFKQALAAARIALSQRDQAGLKRYLAAAAQDAQGPDDQAAIERITLMGNYLEKYWEGIGRTMSQLAVAEEIILGKDRIAVVETDAASITVHAGGKNYTYTIAQLPPKLMSFMAGQFLRKEPAAKVYYAVYLAMSPNEDDRKRARALLEEAAKQDSDAEKLLPELDEAPVPSGQAAAANKPAPPEKARLDQILQTIREKYKIDYDQASTPTSKGALAKILLDNGRTTLDDMDQRFGILDAARQEAIAAGDAALACEAVDEIGKLHAIDVFQVKIATLEGLGDAVHNLAGHREIADSALTMAGTAMDANRLDDASRLAKLAMTASQKAKNVAMARQARMLYLQIEGLRKQK